MYGKRLLRRLAAHAATRAVFAISSLIRRQSWVSSVILACFYSSTHNGRLVAKCCGGRAQSDA